MIESVLVNGISEAIAIQEGYYKIGSLAQRNSNPGNLRSWGARPIRSGYAQFLTKDGRPDADAGWGALREQVKKNIGRGLTLLEFFGGKPGVYAGFSPAADHNDPVAYADVVGRHIGIPVDVPLNRILQGGTDVKKRSWKSTLAGILMVLGSVGAVVKDPVKLTDPVVIGNIAGGVGLIAAKDDSKD